MSSKVLLTISILISNRPDTVRKCLDSVKPLLAAIPSELILTDTGCGEQVRSIIEEYTDHIIDFEWCRDFSKARNAGLKQAKGEWFLFLDDDEWFEDVSEIIDFFKSGAYKKYGLAAYIQRNYLDLRGSVYTDLAVGRMVRLESDIHFIYSIHECFNRVPGEVKKLHSYVHHYGYAYKTREEALAHSERNISLLLIEHEKHPENMKHTLQLAQEYNAVGKRQESLELSLDGIAYAENNPIDMKPCLASLYGNAINCYMELKQYDEVIEKGEEYLKSGAIDPLVEAMIEGLLSGAYLTKKQWEKSALCVTRFMESYAKEQEQDDIYLAYTTTITSDCFEQNNLSTVLGAGVRASIALNKSDMALQWFRQIDLTSQRIFISNLMISDIIKALAKAEGAEEASYLEMCDALVQRAELGVLLIKYIKEAIAEDAKARSKFAGIASEHWYFTILKIQTGKTENKEDFIHIWKQAKESLPDIVENSLWELAEKYGLSNQEIIEGVPLYLWKEAVENYCRNAVEEKMEALNGILMKYLQEDTWHLEVWKEHYLYAKLLRMAVAAPGKQSEEEKTERRKEVERLWTAYATSVYNQAEALYRAAVLQEAEELLPAKIQAAKKTLQMWESVQQGNYAEAVKQMKAVRELIPALSEIIKMCLENLQELIAQQNQAANQFAQLAAAVKEKVRDCIAGKDYQSAEAILMQLEAMLPGDAEIMQLRRQLEDLQC